MSKLEFFNKFLFQLFFIRLTKHTEREVKDIFFCAGTNKSVRSITKYSWFTFQGWVVPFTGWNGDFKFIGKRWFSKPLTKKYIIK
jgi:hypothetical protein